MRQLVSVLFLFSSVGVWAEDFLPKNTRQIQVGEGNAQMNEATFNAIIDKIEKVYAPIVAQKGAKLVMDRRWTDPTVNASSGQDFGRWYVHIFGGLARDEAVTFDAFALMVCHELGHHLGGLPRKHASAHSFTWPTTEGQADYFASLKCFRRVFADEDVEPTGAPETLTVGCHHSYADAKEFRMCVREGMAGLSLGTLFAEYSHDDAPKFETPDTSIVTQTIDMYPSTQCRLDSYFQGALCTVPYTSDVSTTDPNVGTCSQEKGDRVGFRPSCWYNAQNL